MNSVPNQPDPSRSRIGLTGTMPSSSLSPPELQAQHLAEKEKIIGCTTKLGAATSGDRDPGAIARAESRLADPDYPDDEILETVALNLILREGL